ncbi:uncharacterized protein LOC135628333 isoform X2 [Musa acuminata AAA Group]|uniref:uncharacterized protein LOC135628333 isoform X2 n=1 Tax=Musa acuminata AAA Group TaxID=214697 RepID=UPI0031E149C3
MAIIVARMASLGQAAYGEAAATVEQTIGSIRTVASFTGERRAVKKYDKSLVNAYIAKRNKSRHSHAFHVRWVFIVNMARSRVDIAKRLQWWQGRQCDICNPHWLLETQPSQLNC